MNSTSNRFIAALAILSLAGIGSRVQAQPPTTTTDSPDFDISRTVKAALDSSKELIQARRTVEISEHRVGEVSARKNAYVSATGSATRFDAPTNVAFGEGPPITVLPDHIEQGTISIAQPLDLLGQVRAAVGQARLQVLADRIALNRIANQRALDARVAYYNVLRAEHQVRVAEANRKSAVVQRDTAQKLFDAQVGQKIDLLRAETQVAEADQEVVRARNAQDVARSTFNDIVGRPLTAPATLQDIPGVTVGTDITAGATEKVGEEPAGVASFTPPVSEVNAIDAEAAANDAIRQRPEVLSAEAEARAAQTGIRLARTGQEPTFSVSAAGNYYPTFSLQSPRERTAALTATVSIPLYDGGATKSRVAQARLQAENAETALDNARDQVRLEVRETLLNMQTAARQVESTNAALRQAVAARQLAQVRYEGQVGLFLEVTDAQAALVRAENAQVNAVFDYLIARARYDRALGVPQLSSR